MINAITISMSDYIFEIGNRFFNIEESDWNEAQDDLDYEDTMTEGINGYVLNLEDKASGIGSIIWNYLLFVGKFLLLPFFKKKEPKTKRQQNSSDTTNKRMYNAHDIIQKRVRSRILTVINEDAHLWNENIPTNKSKAKTEKIIKNPFKNTKNAQRVGYRQHNKAETKSVFGSFLLKWIFERSFAPSSLFKMKTRI